MEVIKLSNKQKVPNVIDTNPQVVDFYLKLYEKATDAYSKEDYISLLPLPELTSDPDSFWAVGHHMDLEMLRIGFEYGRVYEKFGTIL